MQPDSKLWGVVAGLEGTARLVGGDRGLQSLQHQQVTRAHVPPNNLLLPVGLSQDLTSEVSIVCFTLLPKMPFHQS